MQIIQYAVDTGDGIAVHTQAVPDKMPYKQIMALLIKKHPKNKILGFVKLPDLFEL